ncbi:D-amino acid aminotransferase [Solemya velesiana gill symbiont]|uniref:Aminodeoxychorismate lyase n=1 Tax=Solemya velesiana gill symbiont TaxID=1918948 RepID=A0A1T2KYA3_9GAMM|nr:D-amino acid aminotransferase [Solemya velesiana gill symbiont]OOZ37825.1 D-amino acid aminotransferase [Solemya velesiana gill symbiont]
MTEQNSVFLNGEFLPREQAQISVMDRGFLFGDGVYEVIPCYSGKLFRLEHHLNRLNDSLLAIHMENPHTRGEWREILEELVARRPGEDQAVYLQVTRGAAEKRDHLIPEQATPTVFAMSNPIAPVNPELAEKGISAITLQDIRWHRCNIKAITLLANVLLREEAGDNDASEAILLRDGFAIEGTASNLFIVSGGIIRTPPKSERLLPGITRDLVLELASTEKIPFLEEDISERALLEADEVWITSSTREIVPVVELNGKKVGNGQPGPMFRTMHGIYADYKQQRERGAAES